MRRPPMLLVIATSVLAAAGCGGASEGEAREMVCDAIGNTAQRVDELRGLASRLRQPPSAGRASAIETADQMKEELNAVGDELQAVDDSVGDLGAGERARVEDAARSLESTSDESLSSILQAEQELLPSLALRSAAPEIELSIDRLDALTRQLSASIDCRR